MERDRLEHFYPAMVLLTVAAVLLEALFASVLAQPALAASSFATFVFLVGLVAAGRELRRGRADRARVSVAIALTTSGAFGAYLVPDLGFAATLLPLLSVIIVLPYMQRPQLLPVSVAAIAATVAIRLLDAGPHLFPEIGDPAGLIFTNAILLGVIVFVLVAVADYAIDARESLQYIGDSNIRRARHTAARLAIASSLRTLEVQSTPEATAALIVGSLIDQPLVDIALILEETHDGLTVLAASGPQGHPIPVGEVVPPSRARYLLARSAAGAWAELWSDRPGPDLEDELMTSIGIKGQAFAPIVVGGEVLGLIGISTTDAEESMHLLADLPTVSESAALAEKILAPALLARRELRRNRAEMVAMIDAGAFAPVFQPVVDLASRRTIGFEALMRFTSGEPPASTFMAAVRIGLGIELETATLAAAIKAGARLPGDAWLSVNVSAALIARPDMLGPILAGQRRPIVIEVTEHELIDDYGPLHHGLRMLGANVRLATDDAGAGVANFRHLINLRPNIVKIDASVVQGVDVDLPRQAVVAGLVNFASVSGALVIAEGIETMSEADRLQRLGVALGQGYLLGRPAPVEVWDPELLALGA